MDWEWEIKKAQAIPPHKRHYSTRQLSLGMHTDHRVLLGDRPVGHSAPGAARQGQGYNPALRSIQKREQLQCPTRRGHWRWAACSASRGGARAADQRYVGWGRTGYLQPTLNGSRGPWVEGMGGGLRSNCSLLVGCVGVLGSLPDIAPHPKQGCVAEQGSASPLAIWTQFLIFLGNKEPARFICGFLSPGLDVSCH